MNVAFRSPWLYRFIFVKIYIYIYIPVKSYDMITSNFILLIY